MYYGSIMNGKFGKSTCNLCIDAMIALDFILMLVIATQIILKATHTSYTQWKDIYFKQFIYIDLCYNELCKAQNLIYTGIFVYS